MGCGVGFGVEHIAVVVVVRLLTLEPVADYETQPAAGFAMVEVAPSAALSAYATIQNASSSNRLLSSSLW